MAEIKRYEPISPSYRFIEDEEGSLVTWSDHHAALAEKDAEIERLKAGITVNEIFKTNIDRCNRWHPGGLEEWSALEWAGAMAGEAGEAANAAKKLKRVESKLQNINAPGRSLIDVEAAQQAVANEVADTILYGLLLMARVGVTDPEVVIAAVFNRKSEEYGFPERLVPS